MHFPVSFTVAGHSILLHSICEWLGIFIGYRYYSRLKKGHDFLPPDRRLFIFTAAALGALLGSHVLGALENVPEWRASANPWLYLYGNKTVLGGVLGGLMAVELVKRLMHEKQNTGDLFTYPLILGMMIGRIGCFSAGVHEETYGLPTSLSWSMDLGDGIHRHPVALYEIIFLALTWLLLSMAQKRYELQQGALFKMFMIAYLCFRFLLDFIKPGWRFFFGLGSIQLAALAGLLYYWRYIIRPSRLVIAKK